MMIRPKDVYKKQVLVISEKSEPVIFLLEGVYGLYVLIPILFLLSIGFHYRVFADAYHFEVAFDLGLQSCEDLDIFAVWDVYKRQNMDTW